MTIHQAAEFLRSQDQYLILTHLRPDGDTVGSAAALCLALRQMGKTAWIFPNPELTASYAPYFEGLTASADWTPDTVVAVDIAAPNRFPKGAESYLERVDFTIDHHPSQEFFAKETYVDASCAACGEIIYEIACQLGPVTTEMATALYVAISTDCGCFAYGNTTANTHRIAAALIELGIPMAQLNKRHFRTKSKKQMQLESALIDRMELYENDTIAISAVTLELMASLQATERDEEGLASLIGQLEGVQASVTIRELEPGRCKLSMRSDPDYLNSNTVCSLLGGGGHAAAAGATLDVGVSDLKAILLATIRKVKYG